MKLFYNFLFSKSAKAAADTGIPVLGTLSSVIAIVFASISKLEGWMLYAFLAIMFSIIASILFFMYLTFSKKYDYKGNPDFSTNYSTNYNSKTFKGFRNSKRGVFGIVKALIMAFSFCVALGLLNHFFGVFDMFHNGLDFIEGPLDKVLGTPVVESVVDMILDGIGKGIGD